MFYWSQDCLLGFTTLRPPQTKGIYFLRHHQLYRCVWFECAEGDDRTYSVSLKLNLVSISDFSAARLCD